MTLENRTLFISGGSRGIGEAIAVACAAQGANAVSYTHLTLPTKRIV